MISIPTKLLSDETTAGQTGDVQIAAAIVRPYLGIPEKQNQNGDAEGFQRFMQSTDTICEIVRSVLLTGLIRAEISYSEWAELFGRCFVLFSVRVTDKDAGVSVFRSKLGEMGLLKDSQIAWRDEKGTWQTVFPREAEPFERFLTDENFRAAKEALAIYSAFLAEIQRRGEEGKKQE